MEPKTQLQLSEFQKALTPQRMLTFRIIPITLLIGATLFLGIVLFLYSTTAPAEGNTQYESVLSILSIVNACLAFICYLVSYFVFRALTSLKGMAFLQ